MEYTLINLSTTITHIQFPGKLDNKKVIWDAKIQTLKSIAQSNPDIGIRQYIDISYDDAVMKSISIGLNVKIISRPEILKTIIMITNYKNLHLGRHEYGELYFFNYLL